MTAVMENVSPSASAVGGEPEPAAAASEDIALTGAATEARPRRRGSAGPRDAVAMSAAAGRGARMDTEEARAMARPAVEKHEGDTAPTPQEVVDGEEDDAAVERTERAATVRLPTDANDAPPPARVEDIMTAFIVSCYRRGVIRAAVWRAIRTLPRVRRATRSGRDETARRWGRAVQLLYKYWPYPRVDKT